MSWRVWKTEKGGTGQQQQQKQLVAVPRSPWSAISEVGTITLLLRMRTLRRTELDTLSQSHTAAEEMELVAAGRRCTLGPQAVCFLALSRDGAGA